MLRGDLRLLDRQLVRAGPGERLHRRREQAPDQVDSTNQPATRQADQPAACGTRCWPAPSPRERRPRWSAYIGRLLRIEVGVARRLEACRNAARRRTRVEDVELVAGRDDHQQHLTEHQRCARTGAVRRNCQRSAPAAYVAERQQRGSPIRLSPRPALQESARTGGRRRRSRCRGQKCGSWPPKSPPFSEQQDRLPAGASTLRRDERERQRATHDDRPRSPRPMRRAGRCRRAGGSGLCAATRRATQMLIAAGMANAKQPDREQGDLGPAPRGQDRPLSPSEPYHIRSMARSTILPTTPSRNSRATTAMVVDDHPAPGGRPGAAAAGETNRAVVARRAIAAISIAAGVIALGAADAAADGAMDVPRAERPARPGGAGAPPGACRTRLTRVCAS